MSKRRSESARVLAFFETAPVDVAQTILEIVRDKVKQRSPGPTRATRAERKRAKSPEPRVALTQPEIKVNAS